MIRRRRQDDPLVALPEAMVHVLLHGWGGPPWPKFANWLAPFELSDADFAHAWHEHRDALTAEAQRRGLDKPWIATRLAELKRMANEGAADSEDR